ncbi:MAG TPA: response regulator [Polyangia bacterium]|nr:response regulator [Polyangia bacterium]
MTGQAMTAAEDYVLVVEDDDGLRETLIDFLYEEGYASCSASSAQEAQAFLQAAPPPCLVILDQSLPDMSAEELVRIIRAMPAVAAVPVCVVTGDMRRAPADADAVIRKPIDVADLLRVVDTHCRGRTGLASPPPA